MTSLDRVLETHPLPRWRLLGWLIVVLLTGATVWARFAHLDEVAIATGEVVPRGKVKTIQHYEGGIISEIHVEEGKTVHPGEVLLQLDVSTSDANREETQVRLDTMLLSNARLRAEADGTPLVFPPVVAERHPDLVVAERRTYEARQAQLKNNKEGLDSQVRQREIEVQQLRDKQRVLTGDLKLAQEKYAMSKSLLEQQLTSKLDNLVVQREVEMLQGDISGVNLQIPRAQAALEEARAKLREADSRFRREALEEVNKNEPQIARTRELLSVSAEQVRRTTITSPIEGVVKDLRFHTVGGVVRPGDPIMTIVPTDEKLVIESKLNPVDRGYVQVGQPALVKISAYDFYRYGGLQGEVTHISPDSTTAQNGTSYFTVVVETKRSYLGTEAEKLPITTGMQATVDIHTGTRSVLEFLLKPVLRLRYEGFRER